jgi:glycosyltransferase involved in cell wall biosynthesis
MTITALILTFDEELHLARCIESVKSVASEIVVIDSFSRDATLEIARSHGARVVQHEWVNYAIQFNWGLSQLDDRTEWVLRIDADEILSPELADEIRTRLDRLGPDVHGAYCDRRMKFQGTLIKHGGVFPVRVLRLFRHGRGLCENRWMDEHIKVAGRTVNLSGEIVDDNLNSLTWWVDKHNRYSNREAVDLLNLEYNFMVHDTISDLGSGEQAGVKRWLKEEVYARLPARFRAFAYFFYRYVIRLGFLDGPAGTSFHFLQGFWYRYLVDAKIAEVKRHMRLHNADVRAAMYHVLRIRV